MEVLHVKRGSPDLHRGVPCHRILHFPFNRRIVYGLYVAVSSSSFRCYCLGKTCLFFHLCVDGHDCYQFVVTGRSPETNRRNLLEKSSGRKHKRPPYKNRQERTRNTKDQRTLYPVRVTQEEHLAFRKHRTKNDQVQFS